MSAITIPEQVLVVPPDAALEARVGDLEARVTALEVVPPPVAPPPPVVPPPPVIPPGEPAYNPATGTLIVADNMDQYTTVTAMGATPPGTLPRIVPNPSPVQNGMAVSASKNALVTGRGGTGKAIRMIYSGVYQTFPNFDLINVPTTAALAHHFFTYWARVSFGTGNNAATIPFKWFMAWHSNNTRMQWNTHWPAPIHENKGFNTVWQVYDQRDTPGQGGQPVGPHPREVWDGQWHRYTHEYRPNTTATSRDGIARMWVDGTKIIDVSAPVIGVTPSGGDKPWCDAADVDALAVALRVTMLKWGDALTDTTDPFTFDVDDLQWWVLK